MMAFIIICLFSQPMWPTFQFNNQRTARSPYMGPEEADILWTYAPGGGITWSSPVIGEDGTIYFGSQDGNLYAINPDGTLKWTYGTNGAIQSSPAIGADGTIYIGSDDGNLYAIEDSITYGKLRWKHEVINPQYPPRGPIMIADGTIYVAAGHLEALDENGNLKWDYNTGISGSPHGTALSHDGSTIYVEHATISDYYLTSLDTSGSINWERDIGAAPIDFSNSTPTVGSDGVIYFPTGYGGPLYAINPNSIIKWNCPGLGDLRYTSPAIGAGDTIYMAGGFGKNFHAIAPAGTKVWTFNTTNYVLSSPIIDGNGTIYIASYDTLYAINPDGTVKWTLQVESPTVSTPAMDTSGNIYICSATRLYAIGPEIGIAERPNSKSVKDFSLQIYPNPFSKKTEIRWTSGTGHSALGESAITNDQYPMTISIYNVSGRLIKSFSLFTPHSSLISSVSWDGTDDSGHRVPAGIYFVQLKTDNYKRAEQVVLLR
ncbi:MAG TPA: T9SS type A sorting domain-containing protein [candidate division WOR-3 bacterium]|uniref:T9SS type A sorting domain-containing protein n=1 Tax=candidate division WOR-3 bacterium TaxID=2052148 RepID=A0A9C9ELA1_UNCW3|nr:T9SS type A sorting domain-containing protein [candidate division WOR-3 bacterium]